MLLILFFLVYIYIMQIKYINNNKNITYTQKGRKSAHILDSGTCLYHPNYIFSHQHNCKPNTTIFLNKTRVCFYIYSLAVYKD